MNAMILAAGRGERLRPVTDSVPKAMVKVRGEYLLDRNLRMLADAGVETVVINLGWLGDQILEHVGSGKRWGVNVVYSPEYENILETGGGIRRALPILGNEPFWVINGDIFSDIALQAMPDLADDIDGHLVLLPTPAHKPRSDFDLQDGRVRESENPSLTFSGVACYRARFFDDTPEGPFSIAPMLFAAARENRLSGSLHTGMWEDIGTPDRLAQVNAQ